MKVMCLKTLSLLATGLTASTALAQGDNATITATKLTDAIAPATSNGDIPALFYIAPFAAIAALIMAVVFYKGFMAQSEGEQNMIDIAQAVRDGAYAYLKRQYKMVSIMVVVLAVVLFIMGRTAISDASDTTMQSGITWLGFIIASFLSGLCGFLGMKTATNASARTTAAVKESLNAGLKVAFRAGAVMGMVVTGFALLDISAWFLILHSSGEEPVQLTTILLSFAMGASLQALFARVGGGIYTKAADVGADLVGKVEAGIPEDDARNPATIADNVGDNVGDVAGMGADLYESYYGSILAAMALAAAAAFSLNLSNTDAFKLVGLIPALAGLGILCSIISIFFVKAKEGASFAKLLKSLHFGVWMSSALIVVGSYFLLNQMLTGLSDEITPTGLWGSILSGLIAGLVIAWGTERYTSYEHKPTQRIAKQAEMGSATVIISGIAEGMISTWIPLLTTVVAILCAFNFASANAVGVEHKFLLGVFGVAIAAVGMLSTLGITLATDAYGPIADNAGGNAEMTHQPPIVRERTDMLDSLGNTTAATGKGFAIGSAALTALALLAAYVTTVQVAVQGTEANAASLSIKGFINHFEINLLNPSVLCGLFIGVMLVMVFCAMTMNAVGRAAFAMIDECRRQFKIMKQGFKADGVSDADIADPLKWPNQTTVDGHQYPDYANCVAISTDSALKEMVMPSLLAVAVPILVGLILGVPGVMGLICGTLVCGFGMAIFMSNAGGAWDNAKKYIETGKHGGKGSDAHKAGVVGDTVGDPFKDTSGPSLNILIKLVSVVSVVFAGLILKFGPTIQEALGLATTAAEAAK